MATKDELRERLAAAGAADLPSTATKTELEEAVAAAEGAGTAGVEGRSLDTETETPNAAQEDRGTFEKVFVVKGGEPTDDDLDRYERNVRQQAQQNGLRTVGDVKLVDRKTTEDRRGETTRLAFEVETVVAATDLGDTVPTVSEVVENEGADKEPVKADA